MYRFSAILIKTEMADFKRIGRNNFKVSIDTQRIPNSQSNLEKKGKKKKKSWRYFIVLHDFRPHCKATAIKTVW